MAPATLPAPGGVRLAEPRGLATKRAPGNHG